MASRKKLRSHDWFGVPGIDSMVHRSWMKNQGLPRHLFEGRVEARFAPVPAAESIRGSSLPPKSPDGDEWSDPTATAVFTLPQSTVPRAILRVTDPDGRTRQVVIEARGLTIGRGEDNDLVTRDVRVSRHHGRIAGRRGTLVYEDLGSTNGSKVNGEPVTEVVLGAGDRLEVGDTALVLEVAAAPG